MVKAIETIYNGYRFRSRLEARWAVFFDTLGIKYEYEKEGFDLNGVYYQFNKQYKGDWYLPDFWLPEQQRYIEIKGQKPTDEELEKIQALECGTGYPSCLFYGLPGDNDGWAYFTCSHESGNGGKSLSDEVQWRRCPICQMVDVNIRHYDGCYLYSEIDGVEIRSSSCECSLENYKDYHRQRIYAGGPGQLRSKLQWQQYRKKPYEEYEEPTKEEFKEAVERFIAELVRDFYPYGLAVEGVDREFHGQFSGLSDAYTAARQARFEYGEKPQPVNVRKEIVSKPKKIRKKLKDYQVSQVDLIRGDRVRHPMFGDGTIEVESRDRSPVYIRFDSGEKSGWFVPFADLLKIRENK